MRSLETTHRIMSSIHSKNTKPEMALRRALWKRGMRYRVNDNRLPGKPDIVFTKAKIVIFCDGDYWHGHNWAIRGLDSLENELEHYSVYWQKKIRSNVERDEKNNSLLRDSGWFVIRIWASEIKKDPEECAERIIRAYSKRVLNGPLIWI